LFEKLKSLGKQASAYSIAQFSTSFIQIILLPVYTRYLTPAEYGIISILNLLIFTLRTVFQLNQREAVLRLYFDAEDDEAKFQFVSTSFFVVVALSAVSTGVLMLLGPSLFAPIADKVPYYPYIFLTLPVPIMQAMAYMPFVIYQIKERATLYSILSMAKFLVITGCILYFVVYRREGAEGKVKGTLIGHAVCMVVLLVMTFRYIRPVFSFIWAKRTVVFGVPLIFLGLSTWLTIMSNRLFLLHYQDNEAVGIFHVAYMISHGIEIGVYAFYQVWMPYYFSSVSDEEKRRSEIPRLATYFIAAGFVLAVLVALFGKEVIFILTDRSYHSAHLVMPILAGGFAFRSILCVYNADIMQTKKTYFITGVVIATLLVNLLLNFLLIPGYAMFGAAWALALTLVFQAAATFIIARATFPVPYEIGRIITLVSITLALIVAAFFVSSLDIGPVAVAVKLGLLLAGFIVLFVVKWFRPGEIAKIKKYLPGPRL